MMNLLRYSAPDTAGSRRRQPEAAFCAASVAPSSTLSWRCHAPRPGHRAVGQTCASPRFLGCLRTRKLAVAATCYKADQGTEDRPAVSQAQRLHCIVSGRVQGVGFRASAIRQAKALGLRGWVRNRRTGEVELLVEGQTPNLQVYLHWLRISPPGSRVTGVASEWAPATGEFNDMDVGFTV